MSSHAEYNQIVSHIHWTARVCFYLSFIALIWGGFGTLMLFIPMPELIRNWIFYGFVYIIPIPTLLLSIIALVISRQPSWREGRELAILGLIMSIILVLRIAEYF